MEGIRKNRKYRNPCLTMHQPWASLLVHGIKHIEGRSWPAPLRGRLWIHAAGKVPDAATIKAMEDFYREIYAVNGITDLQFPQQYPVSRLIGCIEVVGCLRREELAYWNEVPERVRLQSLTDFCWLCEQPQKLHVPIEMRGFHGVYELERKIYEAAIGDLVPLDSSLLVKFQLPNPKDPFSLKPGSISSCFPKSKASEVEKSSNLSAAIAAAIAAATQFSKKGQNSENNAFKIAAATQFSMKGQNSENNAFKIAAATQFSKKGQNSQNNALKIRNTKNFTRQWQLKSNSFIEHEMVSNEVGTLACHNNEGNSEQFLHAESSNSPGPHKILAAAMRGLRLE